MDGTVDFQRGRKAHTQRGRAAHLGGEVRVNREHVGGLIVELGRPHPAHIRIGQPQPGCIVPPPLEVRLDGDSSSSHIEPYIRPKYRNIKDKDLI